MNLGRVTFDHVACLLRGPRVPPTDYMLLALTSSAPPHQTLRGSRSFCFFRNRHLLGLRLALV